MCDRIAAHNELSPIISKLEFLSRIAPMLDNQQEYFATLGLINGMMGDYVDQLRRALDAMGDRS
jgi:hypothetical protein